MDWPGTKLDPLALITPWSEESLGSPLHGMSAASAIAGGTVTQNQAEFYPFSLDKEATAVKMFVVNGATVNGNTDVGIYDREFKALVTSGATLQAGASALQEFNITDTVLPPGRYWMAISTSSATATFFRHGPVDELAMPALPLLMVAAATPGHPLPTPTATPVRHTGTAPNLILMGVAFDTLI